MGTSQSLNLRGSLAYNSQGMTQYIIFIADVQKEQVAKLRQAITDAVNSGATDIYLVISSGGGLVVEGLAIAALLKGLSIEVTTHNIGQTDSVANVIFASGKKRYANKNASFLFHGVNQPINNANLSETQLLELYKGTVRLREMIALNFSSYTGIPLTDVTSLMVDGANILSASDALSKTVIHELKELNIPNGSQIVTIGNA